MRRGTAWLALLVLAALPATVSAGPPQRGDPAARLPAFEHGSDVWDLTVALDDGGWIVAQVTISNLGPGDRTAAAVGHVVASDGAAHEFHKVRREGQWQLSPDRRRIDLDSIIFDQRGDPARFYVSKKRVDLDLWIDLSGERAWSDGLTGGEYGFDLLAVAAPVRGALRLAADEAPREVAGRATLTHRWMDALEAGRVDRRTELFGFEDEVGVYLTEVVTPEGAVRRWLVVGREGRIVESTERVALSAAPAGGVSIRATSVRGRVGAERELLRDEPLMRVPWPARWLLGRITSPRFVWNEAPFELTLAADTDEPLRLSRDGLIRLARFDPDDRDDRAGPAAPANAGESWEVR